MNVCLFYIKFIHYVGAKNTIKVQCIWNCSVCSQYWKNCFNLIIFYFNWSATETRRTYWFESIFRSFSNLQNHSFIIIFRKGLHHSTRFLKIRFRFLIAANDVSEVAISLISADTTSRKANEMLFRARPVNELISEPCKPKHKLNDAENLRTKSNSNEDIDYVDSDNSGKSLFQYIFFTIDV